MRGWLYYEKEAYLAGYNLVAGLDEAGRGSIAGPVVAAAVILPTDILIEGIDDSKRLSQGRREGLYDTIINKATDWNIGIIDNFLIDRLNILVATHLAMREAILKLSYKPDLILIDGFKIPDCPIKQFGIKQGDRLSQSIAAASILAKVTRDRMMNEYDKIYPDYGFSKHKGYPTKAHCQLVKEKGPSPIHRRTFRPIRSVLN